MPAFIMGGLSLAQGVFGAFGQASQASAQAMAAEIQQRNENFRQQWANESKNRQLMVQYQANLERTAGIERGANKERAMMEMFLDQDFLNKKGTLSKESTKVNDAFISAFNERGVAVNSGTARALLRQNMSAITSNMLALKKNHRTAYQDIENQQLNRLASRNLDFNEQTAFIPQRGGIVDSSSSALTTGLIMAGIGAASTTVATQLEFGKPGSWLH